MITKSSSNLMNDRNSNAFKYAEEVAEAWNVFLTSKFSVIDAELKLPTSENLSCTIGVIVIGGVDDLTKTQFK